MSTSTPTPPTGGRRRWPTVLAVGLAVAAVVVLVWLLVVRALLGDDAGSAASSPEPSPAASPSVEPSAAPSTEPTPAPSATEPIATDAPTATEPAPAAQVTLWFTGEHTDTVQNPALYPEPADVPVGPDPVQAAVDALLSTLPADPDYSNAFWDVGSESSGRTPATATVTSDASGTRVDLSQDAFGIGVGSAYAELGVQQLVHTVLSNGGTAPVQVTVDGVPEAEVWGVLALQPAYEEDQSVWTSASIVSVRHGAEASSPVTLSGVGFGFEGELDVLAIDEATGAVVHETFVPLARGQELTADGEPVRSKYMIDLALEPGSYRLVVADGNASDEGPQWVSYDDKVVTVG